MNRVSCWYTADELAGRAGLPAHVRNVRRRAQRDGWRVRRRDDGRREYHIDSLPADTQAELVLAVDVVYPPPRQRRNGGGAPRADIDPEAWDFIRTDYLRPEAPCVAACYERLQRAAAQRGWRIPSARTMYRRLEEIPRPVRLLAREGAERLKQAYPAQERDRSIFHALEAVNADGHKFDLFCTWPDGTIARPVMVAWQDLLSGKILSWRTDRTEHSDLVRLSFGDMVERWGIPSAAWLDNGRGFAAKLMTGGTPNRYRFRVRDEDPLGIIVQTGVKVHWTTPYAGQSKPIERAFRDLCEYVAKHPAFAGAYTGNSPNAKPENYASRAVPIAEFLRVLDTEIRAHNARPGRRTKMAAGRSFDQVFQASYERVPIRRATAEQRRLWLLAAEGVSASRVDGSVRLAGNRYWTEELSEHAGTRVVIRFDPDALHQCVHAYTLAGAYIGEAECIQAAGFNDTTAARDHARERKRWMRAQREQLAAERRMHALDVAKLLPDTGPDDSAGPPPQPKVLRPAFRRQSTDAADFQDDTPAKAQRESAFDRAVDAAWDQFIDQVI